LLCFSKQTIAPNALPKIDKIAVLCADVLLIRIGVVWPLRFVVTIFSSAKTFTPSGNLRRLSTM